MQYMRKGYNSAMILSIILSIIGISLLAFVATILLQIHRYIRAVHWMVKEAFVIQFKKELEMDTLIRKGYEEGKLF